MAPHVETVLGRGDLITAVVIPASRCARRSHYLKVRDRASFEFALASAAVGLDVEDDGLIVQARVAVGGVATTPWRLRQVEQALVGERVSRVVVSAAAGRAAEGAVARPGNAFKIELLKRTVARALQHVAGLA
jgi:xanthine dehydrogenase YagS FAD-binding subunit